MGTLRNDRYEKFCQDVVAGVPLADAYAQGGWTGGVTNAHVLRRRDDIDRRIGELQSEAAQLAKISAGYLQRQLLPLAESNIADMLEKDGEGRIKLRDPTTAPRHVTASIKSVTVSETGGLNFTLYDKVAAATTLLRSCGGLAPDKLLIDATVRGEDSLDREMTTFEKVNRFAFAARSMLQELEADKFARLHLAHALRGTADEFLIGADPADVATAEQLASDAAPPLERARAAVLSVAKAARTVKCDREALRFLISGTRLIVDAVERETAARAEPNGQLRLDVLPAN